MGEGETGEANRVRTAVRRLRQKLGDHATDPAYIFNGYGVSYRIARPDDA